jgi:hypothetical protein
MPRAVSAPRSGCGYLSRNTRGLARRNRVSAGSSQGRLWQPSVSALGGRKGQSSCANGLQGTELYIARPGALGGPGQGCRVGPGTFTPSPSQIRTGYSRIIRLVSSREGCRLPLNEGLVPANRLAHINGDDPPPSLQPHYRVFVATTRQSAPLRRIGTFSLAVGAACAFPLASPARFSRSAPEPDRASRCPHAGCRSVGIRTSSELIPEDGSAPVLTSSYSFRRFRSSSLALASLDHTCRGHRPDVSATLTTVAFDRSRSRWLGIGDLITEPEGPSFISNAVAQRRVDRRCS